MEYIYIYVSELAENQTSYLLENIYTVSNKNNLKIGVSGILLFDGKYFLQILEGDEKQVNSLMENKIKKDLRHKNIITIIFEAIHLRNFTNWSMRVNFLKSNIISDIYKNAQNSNQLSFSPSQTSILRLILILIKNAFSEKNEFLSSKDKFDYEILTRREREVLQLIVQGYSSKNIGAKLNISEKTAARHTENIRIKLNCNSKSEIIKSLFDSGYITFLF